jgi:DnaK suppressor protein
MTRKLRVLSKTEIAKFQKLLEAQRKMILSTNKDKVARADFHVSQEDLMDEADLASSDIDQSMRMRLGNREALYLKKVDQAIDRIKDGVYGECVSCGEEIGMKRLEARLTAELCILCKEEEEKKENLSAMGRKPKSLGVTLNAKLTSG